MLDRLAGSPALNPVAAPASGPLDPDAIFDDPPEPMPAPTAAVAKPWLSQRVRRTDFAGRDAANRRLGRLGEEFVVRLERHRLTAAGRDDLAARVRWVADEIGDGLGFDVLSYDEGSEVERLVEVKTTGLGKHAPFYVTAAEVRCSEDVPDRFRLYRVSDFAREPRVYVLAGSLRSACRLEPAA